MAGTLETPTTDAPQTPAPEAPLADAARPCATCGRPLAAAGQDWCLECGAAQPGRLGGRPGWRAALSVLGVTLVLVGGAGAAAYAALTTEAQRDATAQAPPAATPQVTPPPAQPVPGEDDETPEVEAPDSESADLPDAKGDAEDSDDSDGGGDTPDVSSGGSSGGSAPAPDSGSSASSSPAAATPIDLPSSAAALYNPYGRAPSGMGNPRRAIDGRTSTAWEAPVGGDGKVLAGVVVSLEEATRLSALEFRVDTPGVTVEVYATAAEELPPDILDSRWEHPASQRDVGVTDRVALGARYRHVLLWITDQPADTKAAIAEIRLFD